MHEFFVRIGQGFGVGIIGGVIINFFMGMYRAPLRQRLIGGIAMARDKGPILGGNIAGWCGSFALFGNGLKYIR